MQRSKLFSIVVAGLISFGAVIAAAQEPSPPVPPQKNSQPGQNDSSKTTIVRPSAELMEKLRGSKSREDLIKNLEQMAVQQAVQAKAFEEFQKHSEGSPKEAAGGRLIGISWIAERAASLPPLTGLVEGHRHELKAELKRSLQLFVRRHVDAKKKSGQIAGLADLIVVGQDADGRQLSAVQIEAKKKLLAEWMVHRMEINEDRDLFKNDVVFCRDELQELGGLDQFLDGEAERLQARVERYLDAIEHGRKQMASEKVKESRETLGKAIGFLKASMEPVPHPPKGHPVKNPLKGPSIQNRIAEWQKTEQLTEDEEKLIQTELEQARKRSQGGDAKQ